MVYDITKAKTFENVTKWLRDITEVWHAYPLPPYVFPFLTYHTNGPFVNNLQNTSSRDVKIALVGNKVDLMSMRTVISDRGKAVCCHSFY